MKKMIPAFMAYFVVCIISILIPASEGYNTIAWKLFVGQVYAIPVLIVVALAINFSKKFTFSK